ncbi:MAG: hypothetical protein A2X28_05200 [Elusimicrobia bacterium GWA2_56_46]|nr:MAG: hypothetical protein A2X28_05200 [Elusimicrobia bacterium GWA2_56_46]OGR55260.1 MAG: hypothetical protein A2X39_04365 [Elusimicrobia bacterium GWC2_56_31]HBW22768.1 hypothetical protein [Elusimicrobiota bacterium]
MILSIAAVLFTFGLVIFLHELGHFLVCKLTKIKVEAFSFGFGPELFGRTSGDTRYSIRAIPLGGYVKPAGENMEEGTGHPDEYFSKPWHTRLAVVLGGPFMNYLLAFVVFTGVILIVGEPVPSTVIGGVSRGYPAEAAGLKTGDRILSVDGVPVANWPQMADLIHKKANTPVLIEYQRASTKNTVKMVAKSGPGGQGVIGVASGSEISYTYVGPRKAAVMGAYQCWFWTKYTVTSLASNIRRGEKPEISGPIGIVNIVSKAAHSGMPDLFFLIALISVAVGFFNLLPIPLLDGGHAVLFIMEGLFRRRITPKVMGWVNSAGIAALMFIMLFATYNDIKRLMGVNTAPAQARPLEVNETAKQFGIADPAQVEQSTRGKK